MKKKNLESREMVKANVKDGRAMDGLPSRNRAH